MRTTTKAVAALLMVLGVIAPAGADPIDASPVDCAGPAGDPTPGTNEWRARDAANMYCSEERHLDWAQHPAAIATGAATAQPTNDPYRHPSRHNGVRFRFESATIDGLSAEVYRPCSNAPGDCPGLPAGLERFDAPYPAVIVAHGGISRKELHWWSSQPLAEAGYLVVAWKSSGASPNGSEARTMIEWALAHPDVDDARIGIAGHSAGGVVSNGLQEHPALSAIVSWDRAQSGEMPADTQIKTPALFFFADYNCQAVPVCQPVPMQSPPSPDGPGNKGNDFTRVKAAGIDAMQIALRAALHLDFVPAGLAGNRYAESTVMYFTTAWFDRYLKGKLVLTGNETPEQEAAERAHRQAVSEDAFERLTAAQFDQSADVHNTSQGLWDPLKAATSGDPVYGGNVPYSIAGMPVGDRLSFYYRSKCFLTDPRSSGGVSSDDIRSSGCSS